MDSLVRIIVEMPLVPLLVISSIFTYFYLMRFSEVLKLKRTGAIALSILHVMIGLVAVSFFAFLEDPSEYTLGVQSLFGAVFFMPLAYWTWAKVTRRSYREVFDTFTVCLVFTLFCARWNCIFSGCCLGEVIPWTEELRWPTREMELIFYSVMMVLFISRTSKGACRGELYPIYMMSYGAFRFVTETLRSGNGLFHLSHLWALLSLCIGMGVLFEMKNKKGVKVKC